MFVVIFIKFPIEKYVVVPEQWIFDINEELLKNRGVNPNRDVCVFYSMHGIDENNQPCAECEPDFTMAKANAFPPPNDEACYTARVVRYFGKKHIDC